MLFSSLSTPVPNRFLSSMRPERYQIFQGWCCWYEVAKWYTVRANLGWVLVMQLWQFNPSAFSDPFLDQDLALNLKIYVDFQQKER